MIFSIVNGGTADLHEKKINFESVKDEIIYFINCAYRGEQSDNTEIKSVGAQWRFSVLKYIRILNRTSPSDDEYLESTYLLIEIYKLLAHGCSSDIFSSANPFELFATDQVMFYKMICDRVFIRDSKYNLDLIAELIYCAACVPVDKSSIYHQQLILEFASRLSKFKTFIPETIKIVESKINEIAENGERNGDFSSNSLYYLGL